MEWIKRPIITIMWALFVFGCPNIYADVEVGNINNIDLGTWSGQSLMEGNDDVCVRSDWCLDFGFFSICFPVNYSVTATGQGSGGAFVASNGSDEIPFRAYYNDTAGITDRVELLAGVELTNQTGARAYNCGADNANFSIDMDFNDLVDVSAGIYQGIVDFTLTNQVGNTTTGQLLIDIVVADMVQISGTDDVVLAAGGIYMQGGDDFCVYRNGGAGYAINVSSANSSGPGQFTLSTGSDDVDYEVFYDDSVGAGSGASALTEGVQSNGFVGAGGYSAGCIAQNASIYIRARGDYFQRSGNYSDTLTIEIIPE